MMILSAVVLLLAFIALAGMVARVQQLASQTTAESDRVILSEVGPLTTSMDQAICRLKQSETSADQGTADFASGATTITDVKNGITLATSYVGMGITGAGIQTGTRILAISGTDATISLPTTAVGADRSITLVPCLTTGVTTTFNLGTATTPRLQDAVAETLNHLESIEAQHGFFLESTTRCWTVANGDGVTLAGQGRAVLELSDGTVWVQIRSTVPFAMSGC